MAVGGSFTLGESLMSGPIFYVLEADYQNIKLLRFRRLMASCI